MIKTSVIAITTALLISGGAALAASGTGDSAASATNNGTATANGTNGGSAPAANGSSPAAAPTAPSTNTAGTQPGEGTPGAITQVQVPTMLTSQGYSNISGITQQGNQFVGQAMKDGKMVTVHVDAATGKVTQD